MREPSTATIAASKARALADAARAAASAPPLALPPPQPDPPSVGPAPSWHRTLGIRPPEASDAARAAERAAEAARLVEDGALQHARAVARAAEQSERKLLESRKRKVSKVAQRGQSAPARSNPCDHPATQERASLPNEGCSPREVRPLHLVAKERLRRHSGA